MQDLLILLDSNHRALFEPMQQTDTLNFYAKYHLILFLYFYHFLNTGNWLSYLYFSCSDRGRSTVAWYFFFLKPISLGYFRPV